MKKSVALFTLFLALTSLAKVGDFNHLIVENSKAQDELHQNLQKDLQSTRTAYKKDFQDNKIVDNDSRSINVPTTKSLLTFKKEKNYYRASEIQQQKRLAEEFSEAQ
jgi:hypothetical protein